MRPNRVVTFDDIFPISAKMRTGTEELKERLRTLLDIYAEENEDVTDDVTMATSWQLREHYPGKQLV